jgi:hypothetical protein
MVPFGAQSEAGLGRAGVMCPLSSTSEHRVAQAVGSQQAYGRIRGWWRMRTLITPTHSATVIGGRRQMGRRYRSTLAL